MKHTIPVESLGVEGEIMAHAVEACVHCGFCLPACPTYVELGEEMDSPRGRIFLMKAVLEGELPMFEATPFIDRCLGCQGCVTACPSGVPYGELLTTFRGWSEPKRNRSVPERLYRSAILNVLERPRLFHLGSILGQLAKPFAKVLPSALSAPLNLLPSKIKAMQPLPHIIPAEGIRRARVAFLAGCAQQSLEPNFNSATLRVLAKNGVEVVIPQGQGCCGAAALHTGAREEGLKLARANLRAFPRDVDAIISNAAGCSSGLKEYPLIFEGMPEQEVARWFASRVRDVSVFLFELGPLPIPQPRAGFTVAYHDACHLAHAQGVKKEPRALLKSIPGLELKEVAEGDLCCGSAGTYNLEQPELAGRLGQRKAKNVIETGADYVVSGNIGCHTQLSSHLNKQGSPMKVMHTFELLDLAYAGKL